MYTARRTIWYFIHVNRTMLKIWPRLTFGWPFANISLTIHQRHSKLYIVVILRTQRAIWHTWKHDVSSVIAIWPRIHPCVKPTWEGAYCPKFCQNIFQHVVTSKPPLTQFRQNVVQYFCHYTLQLLILQFYLQHYIYKKFYLFYFSM